jgi:hypothetical protein
MATRGVSLTVVYIAWDTASNTGKTGDVANHTLRWIKDGTAAAPTNSPVEVDATNAPGAYKLTLTASECDCNIGWLVGKSSTSGVSLMPVKVEFERLPDAAPGGAGGVPTVDANNRIAGIQGSKNTLDALNDVSASQVWTHANRTLTAFGFTVTVGTNNDKTGYTLTTDYDRAKTALANTEYTAPDNAGVAAIKSKTDRLTFDASDRVIASAAVNQDKTGYSLTAAYDRAKNALAFSEYVTPDNASITAIKGQTDKLTFDASNRVVTNVAVNQDKTGYSLTPAYDRAKDALKVTEYIAPDNTTIGAISTKADAIKAKTDKLTFNASNQVEAVVSGIDIDEGALGAAVWDAMRGDHQTPGTTGEALNAVMAMAGGSGARTISVTVTDGTSPLEGALVRFRKGSESYIRATDASGQTTFALDDGTWSWRVTMPGYVGQTGTLVIDGDKILSVTLAAVTIMPSDPGFVTGYAYCYDPAGQPEAGVQVHVQMLRAAPASGLIADGTIRTLTSDASGLVQVTNMIRGAMYQISRGTARGQTIVVPADAPDVFALPSLVGRP